MKSDCEQLEVGRNRRRKTITTVCTMARLAQWKIESLAPHVWAKSSVFRMGSWNWRLQVKRPRWCSLKIWLSKEEDPSADSADSLPIGTFVPSTNSLPIVTFVLRVLNGVHRQISSKKYTEVTYQNPEPENSTWIVETEVEGIFFIEAEFLDMKINTGISGDILFFYPENILQSHAQFGVLNGLNRMLEEDGLHKDVTIETTTGVTKAHLAVLASRSPVFQAMFEHDLKERNTRTIKIEDMTLEELKALLCYMYGTIKHDMFQKHRIALLQASDKYDMHDLKEVCEESLIEDINQENVVERLQNAWVYQLLRLKSECFRYLFQFGKVYDVQMELYRVLDKDLIIEMFQEGLNTLR